MKKLLYYVALFILLGCSDDNKDPESAAMTKACEKCGLVPADMAWLDKLVRESKAEPSKSGNFYAVKTSVGVLIVHQPMIASCLGCVRYDCNGEIPVLSEQVVINELIAGMTSENLIYSVY
jgi:hypothetical protein